MNDQPVERTRHISITRTGADGMVSQTEVHITAVHHRSVDTGSGPLRRSRPGRAYRYGGRLF